jgi:GNAT superfamily N-acetyltransferase
VIIIKKLSECTLNEALAAWNTGFEGYFFDATMDVDRFAARLGNENISADLSIVAFDENIPVGLLLSGHKSVNGNKIAWNGGTGVASDYRRKGIGKLLLDRALELYEEAGVHLSTLEAISENERAIALYKLKGYKVAESVIHLTAKTMPEFESVSEYQAIYNTSSEAQFIPIYQSDTPWQSQWWCMKEGQTVQLLNIDGETVAYGMFKRNHAEDGALESIVVTHCFVQMEAEKAEVLLESLFSYLFPPSVSAYQCTVAFFPTSRKEIYEFLLEKGFTKKVEQVWMKKPINERVLGGL